MSIFENKSIEVINQIKKQIPFAVSKALNDTGFLVIKGLKGEMVKVFRNPTPWTLNSLKFKKATKADLSFTIKLADFAGKATPPVKYLSPQIFGGRRNAKSFELKLRAKGFLSNDMFAVAGRKARLNKYGNMSPAQIVQILSALQAFEEVGYEANQTIGSRKRNKKALTNLFVIKDWNTHLEPGVYQRTKKGIKPLLIFIKNPSYQEKFKMFKVGESIYDKEFSLQFEKAIQYALSTAR